MALTVMNDGLTDISAAHDGQLYNFRTNGDYVFKGIGNEFKINYSNLTLLVTVQSGEGVCGGRHVTEKKIGGVTSSISLPANSSGYLSVRIDTTADPDTFLRAGSTLSHQDLNNGGTVRDLPLYAYVTGSAGIISLVDIRPISAGNGFILRMESDGELYADYVLGGVKRHRKIKTSNVTSNLLFSYINGELEIISPLNVSFNGNEVTVLTTLNVQTEDGEVTISQ